ncbi:MAG: hypothetical protein AAGM84_06935 [Pseudomonadota bacterium]
MDSYFKQWRDIPRQEYSNERGISTEGDFFSFQLANGKFEETFLFDSIAWSSFANRIVPYRRLPYSSDGADGISEQAHFMKLGLMEGELDLDMPDSNPELQVDITHGAVRPVCSAEQFEAWSGRFLAQVDCLLDQGADVIMAGEFACPTTRDTALFNQFTDALRTRIYDAQRPVFMVAGSRHTPATRKLAKKGFPFNENVGLVFGGDGKAAPGRKAFKKQPISHRKRSAAIRIRERIMSPIDDVMSVYKTPFGNIGVLICSDAFDTRILFSYLRENVPLQMSDRVSLILVPAYNTSDLFFDSCRYLSYLANTTVAVVNSRDDDFPEKSVRTYVCGIETKDLEKTYRSLFANDVDPTQVKVLRSAVKTAGTHATVGETSGRCHLVQVDLLALAMFCKSMIPKCGRLVQAAARMQEGVERAV